MEVETREREGRILRGLIKIRLVTKLKGHIKKDCWKWKKKTSSNRGLKTKLADADASYVNDNDDGGILVGSSDCLFFNKPTYWVYLQKI